MPAHPVHPAPGAPVDDEAVLAAVRAERLRTQVALLRRASPFYAPLLAEAGIGAVDDPADLGRVPVTGKKDFLARPDDFRLALPGDAPLHESALAYLIYTTGTTSGRPAPLYITTSDDWAYLLHARRCAEIIGTAPDEILANLFPLTPFPMGARVRVDRTAAALGVPVVQGHTGRPTPGWPVHRRLDEAVEIVRRSGATVLWGVSGFVRRFLLRAAEQGVRLPAVRWCFVTGEATSPERAADLRAQLALVGAPGARVVDRYGSTEGWSMVACDDAHGWHNPTPEEMYVEAVDPETGLPVPDGQEGQLLVTHLRTRGTALLRYAVGDRVRLTRERCPACGRLGERVTSVPRRTGSLVKVNGTLVDGGVIADRLAGVGGLQEWRVAVEAGDDALAGDRVVVEIAVAARVDVAAAESGVVARVREVAHLSPAVRVLPADAIFSPTDDAKPRRFVDRRPVAP